MTESPIKITLDYPSGRQQIVAGAIKPTFIAAANADYPLPSLTPPVTPVNPNPVPTPVVLSAAAYTNVIHVGSKQTVKTVKALIPLLKDSTIIFFAAGETFPYDETCTIQATHGHMVFQAEGTGARPLLVYQSATPAGHYPLAINAAGTDIGINGLSFAAGNSSNTTAIQVTGTNVLIENCDCNGAMMNGNGIKILSTHDVTVRNCNCGGYEAVWLGKGGQPEYLSPPNKNISVLGCVLTGALAGHDIRVQLSDGVLIDGNTLNGPARDGATLHESNNIIFRNNHLNGVNIGTGALSKGVYVNDPAYPPGPNQDFCLAMNCTNVLIEGNTGALGNDTGITFDIGTKDARVINNTLTYTGSQAINCSGADSRYPKRLPATFTQSGNVFTKVTGAVS